MWGLYISVDLHQPYLNYKIRIEKSHKKDWNQQVYNQKAHYYIDIEKYYLCNQKFREVANLICDKYLWEGMFENQEYIIKLQIMNIHAFRIKTIYNFHHGGKYHGKL